MKEPEFHRLKEYPEQQENPNQQGYPTQLGSPPAYTEHHRIGFAPTTVIMERERHIQPDDYMCLSIFVLIFCCLPAGIVALVNASKVRYRFETGDYDGAMESSRYARIWARGGLLLGILLNVSYIVARLVVSASTTPTTNEQQELDWSNLLHEN